MCGSGLSSAFDPNSSVVSLSEAHYTASHFAYTGTLNEIFESFFSISSQSQILIKYETPSYISYNHFMYLQAYPFLFFSLFFGQAFFADIPVDLGLFTELALPIWIALLAPFLKKSHRITRYIAYIGITISLLGFIIIFIGYAMQGRVAVGEGAVIPWSMILIGSLLIGIAELIYIPVFLYRTIRREASNLKTWVPLVLVAIVLPILWFGMLLVMHANSPSQKALRTGNVNLCEEITGNVSRDRCYKNVAIKMKDPSLCPKGHFPDCIELAKP